MADIIDLANDRADADIKLINTAAALLDTDALELRMSHNVDHRHPDWTDEPQAKAAHDLAKSTSEKLYALAQRMKGRNAEAKGPARSDGPA